MAIVRAIRSPCATVSAVMAISWRHTFLVPRFSDATLAGVNVLRSNLGLWGAGGVVVAGLLLSTIATFADTPDQLYQTWQKNFLTDPAISEKAAEEYLRAAPQGPHAQDIKVWLDAYQRAMANLMTKSRKAGQTVAQNAPQNSPKPA